MNKPIRVCATLCALILTRVPAAEAQTPTTALYIDSQPGDYVGQGQRQTWLPGDLNFRDNGSTPSFIAIRADNWPAGSMWWNLTIAAPQGSVLTPGTYENARDAHTGAGVRPGLNVSGIGRSCNAYGRFQVYEVEFGSDGELAKFAADFEQHCEDAVPALFGAIRFNSTRSSLVPFDGLYPVFSLHVDGSPFGRVEGAGLDCGNGGTDCDEVYAAATTVALTVTPAPGYVFLAWTGDCGGGISTTSTVVGRRKYCSPILDAVPGSGNPSPSRSGSLLFIDSQPGEFIGSGTRWVVTSADSMFAAGTGTASHVQFTMRSPDGILWSAAFSAPQGMNLAGGTFEGATRDAFRSPLKPGLDISGRSRGCSRLRGRFVVYELTLSPSGEVQGFAADFEQHCDAQLPGLFGALRFNSTRAAVTPFDGLYPVHSISITPPSNGRITSAGIECAAGGAADCEEHYSVGGSVSIAAQPDPGYVFLGWTGDCSGPSTTTVAIILRPVCGAVFDNAPGGHGALPDHLSLGSLFFYSQQGDHIGQGQRQVWTMPDTLFRVVDRFGSPSPRIASFTVTTADGDNWSLDFAAPVGHDLRTGDFTGATRVPFQAASVPGMSISGRGRGCNQSTGRFRIHEIHFDSTGRVDVFAADFEQHCEGLAPALFGSIRFNSTRSSLMPFDGAFVLPTDLSLDGPGNGSVIGRPFLIHGWALNRAAASGTGVDTLHAYAFPADGTAPMFLGIPAYGASRPDVGAIFGSQFTPSGFSLTAGSGLAPGNYLVVVFAHNTVTGTFDVAKTATVTIPVPVSVPHTSIDLPAAGTTVTGTFNVDGWSIDTAAPSGTGIDAVHVYAFKAGTDVPIFLGVAAYGATRADVGAIFGGRFSGSGYHLSVSNLASGVYTLVVFARSTVSGQFSAVTRTVTRVASAMSIDSPSDGALVGPTFLLGGWAFDGDAPSGPGVDTVHVWAFPSSGGAPIFAGVADYGAARPDVGAAYGSRFTASGFNLAVTGLSPGTYLLAVYAHSVATGQFNQLRTVTVTIQ